MDLPNNTVDWTRTTVDLACNIFVGPLPLCGWPVKPFGVTYHTLVGLLSRVDSHMDEQLVAGVEWLVATDASSPEASEVLTFPLVDMHLFDVPHKLFLLVVRSTAVNPAAHLFIAKNHGVVLLQSLQGHWT